MTPKEAESPSKNTPLKSVRNYKVIFVDGTDCEPAAGTGMQVDDFICNPSWLHPRIEIAKLFVCNLPPSKTHPFVKKVVDKVREYLTQGHHVLLCGFSYGGAVCSRVAEVLSESKDIFKALAKTHLQVATFGSIYIPPKDPSLNVARIVHYMYYNDVALKCNKLNPNDRRVMWLRSTADPFSIDRQKTWLGNNLEWGIHLDYDKYIDAVLLQRSADAGLSVNTVTSTYTLLHIIKWTRNIGRYEMVGTYRNVGDNVLNVVKNLGSTLSESTPPDTEVFMVETTTDYNYVKVLGWKKDKDMPWPDNDEIVEHVRAARNACPPGVIGIKQDSGTCWFNAALNSLLISHTGRTLLTCKVGEYLQSLTEEQRAAFLSVKPGVSSCPISADRAYLYSVVYHTLAYGAPPRAVDVNRLIKSMGMKQRPLVVVDGWMVDKALRKVYTSIGINASYVSHKQVLGKATPLSIKGAKDSQLIVVEPSTGFPFFKLDKPLPNELIVDGVKFILDAGCVYVRSHPLLLINHYAAASFTDTCNERRPVVYDSNNAILLDFDWTRPAPTHSVYKKMWSINIAYAVYSRVDILTNLQQKCNLTTL